MKQSIYNSVAELNQAFVLKVCSILEQAIKQDGRASLIVSGGRTPVALFQALSMQVLDWSKVDISLADERWVEVDDPASNEKMLREQLLQNNAAVANFVGLKNPATDANDGVQHCNSKLSQIKTPFDVLILGMGEDGHTASLFPCSDQIEAGLDMQSGQNYIAVSPTTAPNQRMSLTLPALVNSRNVFLHLTGESKKQVLQQALSGDDFKAMPIRAVLNHADVELVWAP